MAATLLGNGHASHRSAATAWELLKSDVVEVTTSSQPRDTKVIWHRRELLGHECTTHKGIPITSIHRTLIDLGDVVEGEVVEDALDRALERRLTSAVWLLRQIDQCGTRGRKGPTILRSILDKGEGQASWLERRLLRALKGSSLPSFFREFQVDDYFLDFAWPEVMLGVEVHGGKWHRKRKRWSRDLARHNRLTALGWTVLHFTWDELKGDPRAVVIKITATYERLALRLGLTAR